MPKVYLLEKLAATLEEERLTPCSGVRPQTVALHICPKPSRGPRPLQQEVRERPRTLAVPPSA